MSSIEVREHLAVWAEGTVKPHLRFWDPFDMRTIKLGDMWPKNHHPGDDLLCVAWGRTAGYWFIYFLTCVDRGNNRNPKFQVIPLCKMGCPYEQFNHGRGGKEEYCLFICEWRQNVVSKEAKWIAEKHWLVLDAGRGSVSGWLHTRTEVST